MEVDPSLAWDGMWKKVSHISYPTAVFETCVPHSKGQYVDQTVLEICSDDEMDSERPESINPPPTCSKDENATDQSDERPSAINYYECTDDPEIIQLQQACDEQGDKLEIPGADLGLASTDNKAIRETENILAPSPARADHVGVAETNDNFHDGDKGFEGIASPSTSSAVVSQRPVCQKGKWFRNGTQRRSKTLSQPEEYVCCHLCKRLFRGTRARNIHTNKAHAVVSSKRKQKALKATTSAVASIEGNTVEETTGDGGPCPLLVRKRVERSILAPSDTREPQTDRPLDGPAGASATLHLASAYTVSSAAEEVHPGEKPLKLRIVSVESTKRRCRKKRFSSASCSVSSSSSLCIRNLCTIASASQPSPSEECKMEQIFIDNRSQNNQNEAAGSTIAPDLLGVVGEKTVIEEGSKEQPTELDTSGHSRAGSSAEGVPSFLPAVGKQQAGQLSESSRDTTSPTVVGSYQCRICNRLYTNRFSLTGHYKSHYDALHKPYSCDECSQRFTSQSNLKYHQVRNCPVLRVKALKNGTLLQGNLPRNTSLLLAKAKRAIARKSGAGNELRAFFMEAAKGKDNGMTPLPTTLSNVRRVALKSCRRKKTAVDWQSSGKVEKLLPNNMPQSPSAVLSTTEIIQAANKKECDNADCTSHPPCQQSYQQQSNSPSFEPENHPTLSESLLPCVRRIIDQAYDSQELRNKIVTLTSAAILSLISQALPQSPECPNVPQTPQQNAALHPNVSASHVLRLMTDILRTQPAEQYTNSSPPGSGFKTAQALDGLKRNEFPSGSSLSASPPQGNVCPNAPAYSLGTSDAANRNASSSLSSPNSLMRRPYSPMTQSAGQPEYTIPVSLPQPALLSEYGAVSLASGRNHARQLKGAIRRRVGLLVQSKTCPKCDRAFVSLSACRSHYTKVHISSRQGKQLADELVQN